MIICCSHSNDYTTCRPSAWMRFIAAIQMMRSQSFCSLASIRFTLNMYSKLRVKQGKRQQGHQRDSVFECASSFLFNLRSCSSLKTQSWLSGGLFTLSRVWESACFFSWGTRLTSDEPNCCYLAKVVEKNIQQTEEAIVLIGVCENELSGSCRYLHSCNLCAGCWEKMSFKWDDGQG